MSLSLKNRDLFMRPSRQLLFINAVLALCTIIHGTIDAISVMHWTIFLHYLALFHDLFLGCELLMVWVSFYYQIHVIHSRRQSIAQQELQVDHPPHRQPAPSVNHLRVASQSRHIVANSRFVNDENGQDSAVSPQMNEMLYNGIR